MSRGVLPNNNNGPYPGNPSYSFSQIINDIQLLQYGDINCIYKPEAIDQTLGKTSPKSTLVENYASLLQNDQFADLAITVGSETFRAHKAILAARSTVFAAMFQHDMQESRCNEITIKDMEPKVFKEVLRFIYTDTVEGMMACELLAAADKYDLDRLKVMCENALIEGITVGSVTKTLIMADLHRAKELKARAIQFIGENLKAMPDWSEFCSYRPDLVAEIFNGIAASK